MITYREQTKITHEIDSVQCDRCERVFETKQDIQEFHHISFQAGHSSPFGDETNVECDLCADCLLELIGDHMRIVQQVSNPILLDLTLELLIWLGGSFGGASFKPYFTRSYLGTWNDLWIAGVIYNPVVSNPILLDLTLEPLMK